MERKIAYFKGAVSRAREASPTFPAQLSSLAARRMRRRNDHELPLTHLSSEFPQTQSLRLGAYAAYASSHRGLISAAANLGPYRVCLPCLAQPVLFDYVLGGHGFLLSCRTHTCHPFSTLCRCAFAENLSHSNCRDELFLSTV